MGDFPLIHDGYFKVLLKYGPSDHPKPSWMKNDTRLSVTSVYYIIPGQDLDIIQPLAHQIVLYIITAKSMILY